MIVRRQPAHSFSSLPASSMRWSASTLAAVAVAWSGFAALPAAAADAAPQAVEIRLWHAMSGAQGQSLERVTTAFNE